MKRHIITAFLLLLTFTGALVQAQTVIKIDSLKKAISKAPADSATIIKYIDFATNLDTEDDLPYEIILNWALAASKKINNPFLVAKTYYCYGVTFLLDDNEVHARSIGYFYNALTVAEAEGFSEMKAHIYNHLTHIYALNGQWNKAIEFCRQSIFYADKVKINTLTGPNYTYLSHGYLEKYYKEKNSTFLDSAIRYTKLGIDFAKLAKGKSPLITLNLNMVKQLLIKRSFVDARNYLSDAEQVIKSTGKLINYSTFYSREADIFIAEKKYDSAIASIEKGIQNAVEFRKTERQNELETALSNVYKQTGDFKKALFYTEKTKAYYDSVRSKENFAKATDIVNKFEREKKDNEIIRLNTAQQIKQLELEKQKALIAGNFIEAKRKEAEIKLLSQEKELQDLQLVQQAQLLGKNKLQAKADSQKIQLSNQESLLKEKQISDQKLTRNYLIGGLALLGALAFILYRNITAKKKAYTQLQHKSEQIKEQALQLSKQAKQIAQFQSQMNPHFVYNALHNIQGLVLTDEKQKANSQIQSLAQLMRKTFANADKDDIPLEEEINYLNKYIEFEKAAFGNNLDFDVQVSKEAEGAMVPPMMIQPFIENAIKHAELKKVVNPYIKVLIETENNLLAINITDNGTGIKKDITATDKLSHSLSVIKSRLDLLFKGRADVNSQPVFSVKTIPEITEGTSIKFYLPLNYSY